MVDLTRPAPSLRSTAERLVQARAVVGLAAFLFVLAILLFVVETLLLLGVPQSILVWMVAAFALAVPPLAAISTRTVSLTEFAVCGRRLGLAEDASAAAVGLFGSVFAVGLAAAFFRSGAEASALALGLCGGFLVSAVLFAPYLRRAASQGPGDFLAARFGGRGVSALAGVIVIAALFPMLVAELSVVGMIGNWTLGLGKSAFITIATILMVVAPLLGGMRGVTTAGVVQFVLMLAALAFASIWMSQTATGYALPLAGYVAAAGKLQPFAEAGLAGLSPASARSLAGLGLCVTLGIAVLPALLMRAGAVRSTQAARSSLARTVLAVALFALACVSTAAIAKWTVEESPTRSASIADLLAQPWIVDWVGRGAALVTLCHAPASEAGIACGTGPLKPGDLAISPDIALVAAPDIAGLPSLIGILLAAGCLTAGIAAGSLLLFGIGRALGHDLLFRALGPHMPPSRRLLLQRSMIVLAAVIAARIAANPPADYLHLALTSLSFAASGLFPALLLAIWWRRANRSGALAGMLAGLAVAAYLAAAELYDPRFFRWLEPVGLAEFGKYLGTQKAALAGVPAGLVIAVLASLVTARPNAAQRAFAAALLTPRDMPPSDDTE